MTFISVSMVFCFNLIAVFSSVIPIGKGKTRICVLEGMKVLQIIYLNKRVVLKWFTGSCCSALQLLRQHVVELSCTNPTGRLWSQA